MTCGTAGTGFEMNGEFKKLGCWCFAPLKNWLDVNCWAYDEGDEEIGWPKELNSLPR